MRLAFITSSFPPYTSGVAVNAATITTGLADREHQVGVFIPTYPETNVYKSTNPHLHLFHLPSIANPFKTTHRLLSPFPFSLLSKLSDFKPDIVHLQEPQFFLFPFIKNFARKNQIPLVCAHHFPPEFITNQLPTWLRKKTINRLIIRVVTNLYNQSDLVITPTKTMKKLLTANGLKTPVAVISNGVDVNKYTPSTQNSRLSKPNILLYLGRLDFDKNLDIFIRAASHIESNYEIWIAGSGKSTGFLKSLTSKLNLDDHVKFLGYIPEEKKVDIYRQATVFVLPSTAEAQSIVSLEAAACGLPLILANSQALPELINPDHPNGVLFSPNDPIDLAAKIDLLLSNPQQLTKMGENSRQFAKTHDIKGVITGYEQVYLSLTFNKK